MGEGEIAATGARGLRGVRIDRSEGGSQWEIRWEPTRDNMSMKSPADQRNAKFVLKNERCFVLYRI